MEEKESIEENLSEKVKKPKRKSSSIILIIIIMGIIGFGYLAFTYSSEDEIDPIQNQNITFDKAVCSQIRVTPTWINRIGIVDEGYTNFNNTNPKEAVDLLINAQVYFVYHSDCGACKSQVGYFGTEWGRYVESGYTIDCKNVL